MLPTYFLTPTPTLTPTPPPTHPSILSNLTLFGPYMDHETHVRKFGVDIVAVIDKSGSMDDGKLRLVKETLHFMISELKAQDRLCLVTFSTKVFTDMKLTHMTEEGKALAEDVVGAIVADGTTNLSGGLYEGLRNLHEDKENVNDISTVMLFTDGAANEGETGTTRIVRSMVSNLVRVKSACSVFTFGYGYGTDADMLSKISDAGGF